MKSVLRKFNREISPFFYPTRESDGKLDVCPVDAFAGQTFCVNVFGHIRNDVNVLMECQSKSEQDLIAQRLVEAQGADPDNSGLTDADLFKFGMSRYYQTPAEVASFSESLTRAQAAKADRLAREASEKAAYEAEKKRIAEYQSNIDKLRAEGKIDAKGNIVEPKA